MRASKYSIALAIALAFGVGGSGFGVKTPPHMTGARAAAIHACNIKASAYSLTGWGDMQLYVYRSCMAKHHQIG